MSGGPTHAEPSREPEIFRGSVFPDLFFVGGGCALLGGVVGFVVGSMLHPFFEIDPSQWGHWAAQYAAVFGVALVLFGHAW